MSSIARAIARVWQHSQALCAAVPFERVFTGRVPSTQQYNFPYVSILVSSGKQTLRTSVAQYYWQLVAIDIWVGDYNMAEGEGIAQLASDAYANQAFRIDARSKVIDVLDGGPPVPTQVDTPTVKAWLLSQTMDFYIERLRADTAPHAPCGSGSEEGSLSSSSGSVNWPEPSSISDDSDSHTGAWPQPAVAP